MTKTLTAYEIVLTEPLDPMRKYNCHMLFDIHDDMPLDRWYAAEAFAKYVRKNMFWRSGRYVITVIQTPFRTKTKLMRYPTN